MSKPANEEEMKKRLASFDPSAKMAQVRDSGGIAATKSLINEKYANPDTSGFTAVVKKDSAENKFSFEVSE
jgi:hypothetical protein